MNDDARHDKFLEWLAPRIDAVLDQLDAWESSEAAVAIRKLLEVKENDAIRALCRPETTDAQMRMLQGRISAFAYARLVIDELRKWAHEENAT